MDVFVDLRSKLKECVGIVDELGTEAGKLLAKREVERLRSTGKMFLEQREKAMRIVRSLEEKTREQAQEIRELKRKLELSEARRKLQPLRKGNSNVRKRKEGQRRQG